MKKIILALMMISSFLFSATSPFVNDKYANISGYCFSFSAGSTVINHSNTSNLEFWSLSTNSGYRYFHSFASYASDIPQYQFASEETVYYGTQVNISFCTPCNAPNIFNSSTGVCSAPPTCTSTQELINNVCVEKCPSGQERIEGTCVNSCNQMLGEYRKSDGTCQDCLPYTNFASRAFCACDSQGSSYTDQGRSIFLKTTGNYTYKQTNVMCDNGLRVAVYTDPVVINPNDYNATLNANGTVSPDTNHTTTPTDTNSTYTPPVQTNNDVVEAIKATTDVSKEIKGEIGKVATDVKAMNEHLAKQGTTFNEVLAAIKANGTENAKSNQLLGDVNTGLTQFKNKFGQWVDDTKNNSANEVNAINGTTSAVNNQGKNITDKLDEVIKAIKEDGNGTSPTDNNNTGKEIDLNETNKKLDTLHDDNNKTHSILDKIAGFLDSNTTVDTNRSGSSLTISDMLPDGGWGWFTTNSIKPKFNISSNNCYCQTAEFTVAGRNFIFPPKELLDKIPFGIISNIMMAFIYILGLKSFLRN